MKNTYEVGFKKDDGNDTRLPRSVQPEPTMGATSSDFIKSTPLDVADTAGVIGVPHIGGDYAPVPVKSASVTGPTGEVETTYDHANLSAKYKYPNVRQSYPPKGGPDVSFNDHS